MRLDEIGENYENLKAKVISYTTNKAEQVRGGLDHVRGGELCDEDWEDVDEVRRDKRCCNCRIMGHFARDCRTKGNGKRKGRDGGKGHAKGKGKMVKAAGKKGSGKSRGFKGSFKGGAGHVARWDTSRQNVGGKLAMWMRTMQTAEKSGNDPNRRRMTKVEECGSSETWRSCRMKK